ncbi:hypothetical protein HMI55_005509 [Coelomomyces lativittatus]|nr:hypothetical protein HMI55_005509 [Coelomomyces lativittatus]
MLVSVVPTPPLPFTENNINVLRLGGHSCTHGHLENNEFGIFQNEALFYSRLYVNDLLHGQQDCRSTCRQISLHFWHTEAKAISNDEARYVVKHGKERGVFSKIHNVREASCHCENLLPKKRILYLNHEQEISERLLTIIQGIKSILIDLNFFSKNITSICIESLNQCTPELQKHIKQSVLKLEEQIKAYTRFRKFHTFQPPLVPSYSMYNDFLQENFTKEASKIQLSDYFDQKFGDLYERLSELESREKTRKNALENYKKFKMEEALMNLKASNHGKPLSDREKWMLENTDFDLNTGLNATEKYERERLNSILKKYIAFGDKHKNLNHLLQGLVGRVKAMKILYDAFV